MNREKTYQLSIFQLIGQHLAAYRTLIKFRLTVTVAFSGFIAFMIASGSAATAGEILMFCAGAVMIAGSANAFNQILERDTDALMNRTKKRPLPAGILKVPEATFVAGILGFGGIALFATAFNPMAALLAALSLLSYSFIYTPMKTVSPVAVFVGAIPGSMPLLIGWVAVTGTLSPEAWMLFSIQFFWQFPHFWAIAWLSHEDYARGGFQLLPTSQGPGKEAATQILIYTLVLACISLIPIVLGQVGSIGSAAIILMNILFSYQAIRLWIKKGDAQARKLMFGSFAYIPVVLLSLWIDHQVV